MAYPPPVFEGSEKRLEVVFSPPPLSANALGLRALPRATIDELMTLARCAVLSHTRGAACDAYVLSESSLFVYPHKLVLKTCGNTQLLGTLPRLLELSAGLGLALRCVRFTRFAYLFPTLQPDPHRAFADEVMALDRILSSNARLAHRAVNVAGGGGNGGSDGAFHVYVAAESAAAATPDGATLEICMTGLDAEYCARHFQHGSHASAAACTDGCGLRAAAPLGDLVDAYLFDPCGGGRGSAGGVRCRAESAERPVGFSQEALRRFLLPL